MDTLNNNKIHSDSCINCVCKCECHQQLRWLSVVRLMCWQIFDFEYNNCHLTRAHKHICWNSDS